MLVSSMMAGGSYFWIGSRCFEVQECWEEVMGETVWTEKGRVVESMGEVGIGSIER